MNTYDISTVEAYAMVMYANEPCRICGERFCLIKSARVSLLVVRLITNQGLLIVNVGILEKTIRLIGPTLTMR